MPDGRRNWGLGVNETRGMIWLHVVGEVVESLRICTFFVVTSESSYIFFQEPTTPRAWLAHVFPSLGLKDGKSKAFFLGNWALVISFNKVPFSQLVLIGKQLIKQQYSYTGLKHSDINLRQRRESTGCWSHRPPWTGEGRWEISAFMQANGDERTSSGFENNSDADDQSYGI